MARYGTQVPPDHGLKSRPVCNGYATISQPRVSLSGERSKRNLSDSSAASQSQPENIGCTGLDRALMTPPSLERLSDRQYVVLLIRALVDRQDQLVSGAVGGPYEDVGEERWVRFREPGALTVAVQTWLSGRRRSQ